MVIIFCAIKLSSLTVDIFELMIDRRHSDGGLHVLISCLFEMYPSFSFFLLLLLLNARLQFLLPQLHFPLSLMAFAFLFLFKVLHYIRGAPAFLANGKQLLIYGQIYSA